VGDVALAMPHLSLPSQSFSLVLKGIGVGSSADFSTRRSIFTSAMCLSLGHWKRVCDMLIVATIFLFSGARDGW